MTNARGGAVGRPGLGAVRCRPRRRRARRQCTPVLIAAWRARGRRSSSAARRTEPCADPAPATADAPASVEQRGEVRRAKRSGARPPPLVPPAASSSSAGRRRAAAARAARARRQAHAAETGSAGAAHRPRARAQQRGVPRVRVESLYSLTPRERRVRCCCVDARAHLRFHLLDHAAAAAAARPLGWWPARRRPRRACEAAAGARRRCTRRTRSVLEAAVARELGRRVATAAAALRLRGGAPHAARPRGSTPPA